MIVNGAAVLRSSTTSGAGQLGWLTDRTVKYMANSAAKNISSLDSHTIVPTLTTLGLMRDPCDGTFSRAEADATEGILAGRPARRRHDPPVVRRHLPWGRVTPPGSRVRRPAGADALVGAGRLGARPAGRRGARRGRGSLPLGGDPAAPAGGRLADQPGCRVCGRRAGHDRPRAALVAGGV